MTPIPDPLERLIPGIASAAIALVSACAGTATSSTGFSPFQVGGPTPAARTAPAPSAEPRLRPAISRIEVKRGPSRHSVELTAEATAPDGGVLSYAWSFPGGTYTSNRGRTVVWTNTTPAQATPVSVTISVRVSDAYGESDTGTVGLTLGTDGTILSSNQPPVVTGITASRNADGQLALVARATDPDQDPLEFAWLPLRGNVSGAGPEVVWTPVDVAPTSEGVAVTVSDPSGASTRAGLTFRIDRETGLVDLAPVTVGCPVQEAPPVTARDLVLPAGIGVTDLSIVAPDANPLVLDAPDRDGMSDPRFTPSAPLEALARLANGRTSPLVLWSSSHPSLARVGWDGLVRARPDAASGSLVVTARSFHDPDRVATLSVTVRTLGNLALEVR
jgi:hypothetical protein